MEKVLIQGIAGCNHDLAARSFFAGDEVQVLPCETFPELARRAAENPGLPAMMAVENTIAGSLLQNYRLVKDFGLQIIGECKLRISHSLMALPGVGLSDIREVNSHPMALMQCAEFLDSLPGVKLVEKDDTAGSAEWISRTGLRDHAAICPSICSELYGLDVLAEGIETNKRNFTRFWVVEKPAGFSDWLPSATVNKAALSFSLSHETGSLSKILTILSFYDMNLTMIQSLPILGHEWEYLFYITLVFSDYARYKAALDAIRPLIGELTILGEFADGEQFS